MIDPRLSTRCRVVAVCMSLAWFAACGAPNEVSDDSLTDSVASRLNGEPEIAPFDLDVEVENGIVTLDGTVRSESQRMEAERIARSTAGVRGVTNEIDVEGSPPAVGAPPRAAPPTGTPPTGTPPAGTPPADVD